jgi:hypothetical protein
MIAADTRFKVDCSPRKVLARSCHIASPCRQVTVHHQRVADARYCLIGQLTSPDRVPVMLAQQLRCGVLRCQRESIGSR